MELTLEEAKIVLRLIAIAWEAGAVRSSGTANELEILKIKLMPPKAPEEGVK